MQLIGVDLGRGYVKGYTEYNGISKECLFRSVTGDGRSMDFSKYDDPIFLEVNNEECFAGDLAEKESFNTIPNFSDNKVTEVSFKLLSALLDKLALEDVVGIMIGVPNHHFTKENLATVKNKYLGKTIEITNKITNRTKIISIGYVNIFRESDAALMAVVNTHKDKIALKNKRLGIATIGFRTTELTFFDKGLKFNDKLSTSKEIGNRTVLDIIQKKISKDGISKTLHEIDNDKDYDNFKAAGYKQLLERIKQELEMNWVNISEMKIFIAGGTALNFTEIPVNFELVDDAQMITAKGLYYVAEMEMN